MSNEAFESKKPDLIAYSVTGQGDESYFYRIGAAWQNRKKGYHIKLAAFPVDGNLVLLPPPKGKS